MAKYRTEYLRSDVIAGFTVWGLLVPEMIAYAGLAGLPPQAGLYTLLASLAIYAVFGTSRQLVVAGTSASAVLVYSAVTALSARSTTSYATLAAGMVVVTGIILVAAGLLRLGFITTFLSRPVMDGFVFGLAIFVTVSQLPKVFGLVKGDGDTIAQLVHLVTHLGASNWATFAVGISSLTFLLALKRCLPRLPAGLLLLVLGIVTSAVLELSEHGVATVGEIPIGLPTPAWPHLSGNDLGVLLSSSVGMMLVIFSEALGAGQEFADKHGYRLNSDQEMLALGLANIGSGALGGLACGGSLSQTAVNDSAGARTELSPIVAACLSLITVIALTPLFTDLPEAVLAALIIHAVSHLMKVGTMRRYRRLVPREFWLGVLTLTGVVVLDVLPGLVLGVGVSLLVLIYRASRPTVSLLGAERTSPGAFVDLNRHPQAVPVPGVAIMRPNAPLFYANAQLVRDAITASVANAGPEVRCLVLDLDATDQFDITAAEQLDKLSAGLSASGVVMAVAHLHQPLRETGNAAGLLAHHGEQIFPTMQAAVDWARSLNV